MTILIVYPGFGDSNSATKQEFVIKLVSQISRKTTDFEIRIFCHGDTRLDLLHFISNLTIIYERGIVGQFLYRHIKPDSLSSGKYSHVMIVLDDIEVFDDFDVDIYINAANDCDIISPCLTNDSKYSHIYMLQSNNSGIMAVPNVELLMYVMKTESYVKYYNTFLNKFTSWMWYIDIALSKKRFTCLVNYSNAVKHHYRGDSCTTMALFESIHNARRHLVPARVVQLSFDESLKNAIPSFDYFVLDPDAFIRDEFSTKYIGNELKIAYSQMHNVWSASPNRDIIAVYLYLYKHGGIWIDNSLAVRNENVLSSIINMLNFGDNVLVFNPEIVISKPSDENLYSILLSNSMVNPKNIAHLSEEVMNNLL